MMAKGSFVEGFSAGALLVGFTVLIWLMVTDAKQQAQDIARGRNLEWCESRGGQLRDGKCWQKPVEIKKGNP